MKSTYSHIPSPNIRSLFVILGCFIILIGGCSHTKPWYGQRITESQKDVSYQGENSADHMKEVDYRVLLIGDTGDPFDKNGQFKDAVYKSLEAWAKTAPEKTAIIFLGDNIYPDGLTKARLQEAVRKLRPQVNVVSANRAKGIFIPGNHDWDHHNPDHRERTDAIIAQADSVNAWLGTVDSFQPMEGEVGPATIDLPQKNPMVRVVVLDTQKWLQQHAQDSVFHQKIIDKIKMAVDTDLHVIVAAHHPLVTRGRHNSWFTNTPLFGSEQDIPHPQNKMLRERIESALKRDLIYVAGHDHSLQVFEGKINQPKYLLVSGAGSDPKLTRVWHDSQRTLFAHQHIGFMVVDFMHNAKAVLRIIEPAINEQGAQINIGQEPSVFIQPIQY